MFVVHLQLLGKQQLTCTKYKTGDEPAQEQVTSGHKWGTAEHQPSEAASINVQKLSPPPATYAQELLEEPDGISPFSNLF